METIVVQLTHKRALKLLEELEELNIIKLIKKNIQSKKKLSYKFAGKLSPKVAENVQAYISKSRKEWNSNS